MKAFLTILLQEKVILAPYTTLKIGGKARFFVRAESEQALCEAFDFAQRRDLPIFVLGGGSNVLISDNGFDGLVLQVALKGIRQSSEFQVPSSELKKGSEFQIPSSELREKSDSELGTRNLELITVGAGEDWDEFVAPCVERDLAGAECLSGIPGFVGGTPVQNVGAYGQEVSETIIKVRVFDRKSKEILELTNYDCKFTYRTSIFNSTEKNRFIVLAVTYDLTPNGYPKM